jgi:hypothetical protein
MREYAIDRSNAGKPAGTSHGQDGRRGGSIVVQYAILRVTDARNGGLECEPEWIWSTGEQQAGLAEQTHEAAPAIDERGEPRAVEASRALEQELANDVVERIVRIGVQGRS